MKLNKIIFLIFLVILLVPVVYSFGVSTPYWKENPLIIAPGQTVQFHLLLQNMVGGEDATAYAVVDNGEEFIKITDPKNEYFVPFGTNNVKVNLEVSVPEGTPDGNYLASILVDTVPKGPSGQVQFGTGVGTRIPIHVIGSASKPEPVLLTPTSPPPEQEKPGEFKISNMMMTALVIAIFVVVLIIVLLYRRRKI